MKTMHTIAAILATALFAGPALAQDYSISWYTIDAGGGTSADGTLSLTGTIGQPDAHAPRISGLLSHSGGFWIDTPSCPADFNADHAVNSQDFFDFLIAFFAGQPAADFNDDDVINSQDFFDFLAAFFGGC